MQPVNHPLHRRYRRGCLAALEKILCSFQMQSPLAAAGLDCVQQYQHKDGCHSPVVIAPDRVRQIMRQLAQGPLL